MKKLNNAIGIKLLSIITIIMLLQSCSKDPKKGCDTPKDYYIYLTAAQLNQTPYFSNPAFDTISFASDKGDTLAFVKTKTDTTWHNLTGQGNPDCGYDQNYFQTTHNTYKIIRGNGSFYVKHKKVDVNLNSNQLEIMFNGFLFYVDDERIGTPIGSTIGITYFETILLNETMYNKVKILYNNYSDKTNYCYLNKEFGLIGIVDGITNIKYYRIKN